MSMPHEYQVHKRGRQKVSRFLLSQKVAPLLPAADEGVIFLDESSSMTNNHTNGGIP